MLTIYDRRKLYIIQLLLSNNFKSDCSKDNLSDHFSTNPGILLEVIVYIFLCNTVIVEALTSNN